MLAIPNLQPLTSMSVYQLMHYSRYIISDQHHLLDDTSHRLLRHQALSRIERGVLDEHSIQTFHGIAYKGCFRSLRTYGICVRICMCYQSNGARIQHVLLVEAILLVRILLNHPVLY